MPKRFLRSVQFRSLLALRAQSTTKRFSNSPHAFCSCAHCRDVPAHAWCWSQRPCVSSNSVEIDFRQAFPVHSPWTLTKFASLRVLLSVCCAAPSAVARSAQPSAMVSPTLVSCLKSNSPTYPTIAQFTHFPLSLRRDNRA